MRCPADRAAYTQVKDQKTSELAPSVKARPITGPLGPIPDVSVNGGGPAAGDGCVSGTCTKLPGSSRPERASANGFANETAWDGEMTRDTGDAHRGLCLVSETRWNTGDVGDVRRMAHNPAT